MAMPAPTTTPELEVEGAEESSAFEVATLVVVALCVVVWAVVGNCVNMVVVKAVDDNDGVDVFVCIGGEVDV